jgi:hypothetical protein
MTRSILVAIAAAAFVATISGTGCQSSGVGDPCTPEAEYDQAFLGFSVLEVNTESQSFQCQTRLCLVNHFQGRVSCPYGQKPDGSPVDGTVPCSRGTDPDSVDQRDHGCCVPGGHFPVDGKDHAVSGAPFMDPNAMALVKPQCTDRTADQAVYCSCRCANVDGQTNDGANYCSCPSGFKCTQLVSSVGGALDKGLTGAYCVKENTQFDPNKNCGTLCDPMQKNCGNTQLQ